ncbi:MAG TPA: zf-HC2 domain-containing protein [Anaeromyxobacter sp.]|nr:zf-HC2 domain-containing protein [Anaeromyxobacter sp.]
MNRECRELEVMRTTAAAGDLSGEEAARLEAHLVACVACREALARDREMIDLVRLPPVGATESLLLADLPARTLSALKRRERRRGLFRRYLAGAAVAAAMVLALLTPAVLRNHPSRIIPAPPAATEVAWQEPDLDTLWSESAVLDSSTGSSSTGSTISDAVLDAYDEGTGI